MRIPRKTKRGHNKHPRKNYTAYGKAAAPDNILPRRAKCGRVRAVNAVLLYFDLAIISRGGTLVNTKMRLFSMIFDPQPRNRKKANITRSLQLAPREHIARYRGKANREFAIRFLTRGSDAMKTVAVAETRGDTLSRRLADAARRAGVARISVLDPSRHVRPAVRTFDALAVSPGYAYRELPLAGIECDFLLIPGDASAYDIRARGIITYGMSPRDTLTLSSVGETRCVLTLRREVPTVFGGILDVQDILVSSAGSPEDTLALAGGLLVLGLTPRVRTYTHT
jgi:hypothetical protein